MTKKIYLLATFVFFAGLFAHAQIKINPKAKDLIVKKPAQSKTHAIKVQRPDDLPKAFFDAMRNADSSAIRGLFLPEGKLVTTDAKFQAGKSHKEVPLKAFLTSIANSRAGDLDERIITQKVQVDQNLATVTTDYDFYYRNNYSHSGLDVFTLVNSDQGWKILLVADTRRTDRARSQQTSNNNSKQSDMSSGQNANNNNSNNGSGSYWISSDEEAVHQMLDAWHQSGADANADAYFGALTDDSRFLGTDISESWSKKQFYDYAKKFFDQGQAWTFKPYNRQVFVSGDKKVAWFEENLETNFGPTRGTGVLKRIGNKWKIVQYNLSALVPNDVMRDYLKLLKKN